MSGNYRTIMTIRCLAKLYASILESKLCEWAKEHGHQARGQEDFRRGFITL